MVVRLLGARLAVLVVTGALIAGPAAGLTVPIPGIDGPAIRVPAALRTTDGGGLLVGWISRHRGTGVTVTSRLDAEGRLSLGYGYEGTAQLDARPTVVPTALAIDPSTSAAWIGAVDGSRSEVFALDGAGQRRSGFGRGGLVRLPVADNGAVRSLAWGADQLLIAAGNRDGCTGCRLTLLDATRGTALATTTVTPAAAGGPMCTGAVGVTSLAFANGSELLAATSATGSGCAPTVLAFNDRLAPVASRALPPGPTSVRSIRVTPDPGATCLAGSGPSGVDLAPLGTKRWEHVASGASTRLVALTSLGRGACAALIQRAQSAEVAQVSGGGTAAGLTNLPARVTPDAMFRCHQHLLVIATRRAAGVQSAEIVPVPIVLGPFATRAAPARGAIARTDSARAATATPAPTTGCA